MGRGASENKNIMASPRNKGLLASRDKLSNLASDQLVKGNEVQVLCTKCSNPVTLFGRPVTARVSKDGVRPQGGPGDSGYQCEQCIKQVLGTQDLPKYAQQKTPHAAIRRAA